MCTRQQCLGFRELDVHGRLLINKLTRSALDKRINGNNLCVHERRIKTPSRSRDKRDKSFTRSINSSERKFLDPFSTESTYEMTEKPQLKCRNFCRGFEALSRDATFGLNGFSLAAEFCSISRRLVVSIPQSRVDWVPKYAVKKVLVIRVVGVNERDL